MLSDKELRTELQQLGFNPGPITAATRSTYLKKLQKLHDASGPGRYTNGNNHQEDDDEGMDEPVHGSFDEDEEEEEMSDNELRAELLRLGHSAGPITGATRSVYLKKLARLQETTSNGHTPQRSRHESPARRGAPARRPPAAALAVAEEAERRRASSARRPSGQSPMITGRASADDEEMEEPPPGSIFAASRATYQSGLFGSRHQGYDPRDGLTSQPETFSNNVRHLPEPTANRPRHEPESTVDTTRNVPQSGLGGWRQEADSVPDGTRYRPSALPTISSRYQPQSVPFSRRYQPTSLSTDRGSDSPANLSRSRAPLRDSPPPQYRPTRYPDDASTPPPYKSEPPPPPPPERPSLRQRVAAWCRPAARQQQPDPPAQPAPPPPPTLDYDTCSDSEDGEPRAPPTAVSATEQLRQFRARMSREGTARRRYSSETTRSAASHLVPACILLLALSFFGVLLFSYLSLGRDPEMEQLTQQQPVSQLSDALAVWPICGTPAASAELGCVPAGRLEPAVALLDLVRPVLVAAARDTLCGRRDTAALTLSELGGLLPKPGGDSPSQLRDLSVLVAHNPQLGVLAQTSAEHEMALEASGVGTPWLCAASAAVAWVLRWAATLATVAGGALAVRGAVWWHVRRRRQRQQQLYQMVERVLDVVRRHSAAAASEKPYVAVDHVRDQLLSPSQRTDTSQVALWNETVQFIRDRESRVREECVLVAGESHTVWRWLPPAAGPGTTQTGGRRWLGQAFQTNNGVNSPVHTRTSCLKIRHMFDPSCETGAAWVQEVRDALLEKCESLPVLHVAVDQRNAEGLVYAKFRSEADALAAFKRIQGCWFDGRLVSVKFIRLERYHERYPDAASAATPLRPSNTLRRSLAEATPAHLEDD